jgi:hypothetical protein
LGLFYVCCNEEPMKKWWKSKTLWLNAVSAGFVALEASFGMLREKMSPEHYLVLLGLLAALNAGLRFITSQPVK